MASSFSTGKSKSHVCAICGRQYQRNTHLRRHEATHTRPNRFKCCYCQKEFARGDVCKKHSLTCPHKDQAEQTAAKIAQDCHEASMAPLVSITSHTADLAASVSDGSNTVASRGGMPFLRQIFNPNNATMQHYLNVANNDGSFNESVPDADGTSKASASTGSASQDISDVIALLPSDHVSILDDAMGAFTPDRDFDMLSLSAPSPIPALTDAGYEVLATKAASLVAGLRQLHHELEANDGTHVGPHDIAQVEAVFSVEKLRFYTAAFFRLSHVHFPLVHYPSFGTVQTSTFLILAVAIFGASRSAPLKHTAQAKAFAQIAEEYIFREVDRLTCLRPHCLSLEQLQTLQGAVAMTNLMINHNDWSLRERARLKRLPMLIYSVRVLKLTAASSIATLDWHQFVYNETSARVATMTAMIDWNQARMFYCPTSLTITEMNCSLPCHRELWDAANATAYIIQKETIDSEALPINASSSWSRSIASFVSALLADDWGLDTRISSLNLTLESMSAASLAITALTISGCQMGTIGGSYLAIVRAICRWRDLWEHITCDLDTDVLLKAGLTRHCHENCTLAQHLAEARYQGTVCPYFQTIGHDSLVPIYNLVVRLDSR